MFFCIVSHCTDHTRRPIKRISELVAAAMAMADFLKDLPTRDADNFTKINPDSCHRWAAPGDRTG